VSGDDGLRALRAGALGLGGARLDEVTAASRRAWWRPSGPPPSSDDRPGRMASMPELSEGRRGELRAAIEEAARRHAGDPGERPGLSRAMRGGYFAGLDRQDVIDRSGLSQPDAERILDG
jgi:hypothetical protein